MNKLEKLYIELNKFSDFEADAKNAEYFLNTVDKIVLCKDPLSIKILLNYFDDESEYSWVFESLSGCLEHYSMEVYVDEILKNFPILFTRAQEWLLSIITTLFNSESYTIYFREHMYLADRESLLELFDLMEKESPHHSSLIQELRKELEKT